MESQSSNMGSPPSSSKSTAKSLSRSVSPEIPGALDGVLDRRPATRFASSPGILTRANSHAVSFRSGGLDGKDWNERQLLVFFDNVRRAWADAKLSADVAIDKLIESSEKDPVPEDDPILSFRAKNPRLQLSYLLPGLLRTLNDLIDEEQSGQKQLVGVDFMIHTHVDKLLDEIPLHSDVLGSIEESKNLVQQAKTLKDMMKEMKSTGYRRHLVDMMSPPDWNVHEEIGWAVDRVAPGCRTEGSLGFQPGQWWLNMHCCMRDGVVRSPNDLLTKGRYGVTALAMIAGEEIDGPLPDAVIYIREGYKMDMPFQLIGNQQLIRVIRGSRLNSKYAPLVGVRYDGLYRVTTYSHKLLDHQESLKYRYVNQVGLERVPDNQAPFETALEHPKPSEVDQFFAYWGDVSAGMLENLGREKFRAWSKIDRDEIMYRERQRRLM